MIRPPPNSPLSPPPPLSLSTANPAAGPPPPRDRRHEIMGFQLHLDDQVTVTAGEHAVEVTVPAEATQRGARAQSFEATPFPGVEGLRRGRVDDGLLGLAAGAGPDLPAVEERGTTLATDPALGER